MKNTRPPQRGGACVSEVKLNPENSTAAPKFQKQRVRTPPQFVRQIERLQRLGPRAVAEPLLELDAGAGLTERLGKYAALDGATLTALGGDRFQPLLIRVVI